MIIIYIYTRGEFFVKNSTSKIEGKRMTATFYDDSKKPIQTVHFGAAGYPDYTVAPRDAERRNIYIY